MSPAKSNDRPPLMVILLMLCTALIVTACSRGPQAPTVPGEEWADDLRSRIERHIGNPQKKSQLIGLVDQEMAVFQKLAQDTETFRQKLLVVDKNYDSTPDDFRAVFSEFNQKRYNLQAQSMNIRFKMQALCTPEEWQDISRFRAGKGLFNQLIPSPGVE